MSAYTKKIISNVERTYIQEVLREDDIKRIDARKEQDLEEKKKRLKNDQEYGTKRSESEANVKNKKTSQVVEEKDRQLLAEMSSKRVDGRLDTEFRKLQIQFGQAYGHVEVNLGKTRVIASANCELTEPYPERPNEGFLLFKVDLSPMASLNFNERQFETSTEIARMIERTLRGSKAIDTESLCVVANSKVWSIRIKITVLDYNGNLMDACHMAAVASLMHFKRPEITMDGNAVTVHDVKEREPIPLSVHHIPLIVSFGFFTKPSYACFVDPLLTEESQANGMISIAANCHGELCGIQKVSGDSISPTRLFTAIKMAHVQVNALHALLTQAIADDTDDRTQRRQINYTKFNDTTTTIESPDTDSDVSDVEILDHMQDDDVTQTLQNVPLPHPSKERVPVEDTLYVQPTFESTKSLTMTSSKNVSSPSRKKRHTRHMPSSNKTDLSAALNSS